MTTKKPSLAEFAETKRPPSCKFCTLPEREEADLAYRNGEATRRVILQWLVEVKGYTAGQLSASAIDKHYSGGHQHLTQ